MAWLLFALIMVWTPCDGQYMHLATSDTSATWLLDESTPFPADPASLHFFVVRNSDSLRLPLTRPPTTPAPHVRKQNATAPPKASPRRKQKRINLTRTRTFQRRRPKFNVTKTIRFPTDSVLHWEVTTADGSRVLSLTEAVGTRAVLASAPNVFAIRKITVTIPGRFVLSVQATVAGFSAVVLRYVVPLMVRPLPRSVNSRATVLSGSNGSALVPGPVFSLYDADKGPAWSSGTVATLTVKDGPSNAMTGSLVRRGIPEGGFLTFDNVVFDVPGTYVVALVVALPDGNTFESAGITVTVRQALPTVLRALSSPQGAMTFVFRTVPVFGLFDDMGPSADAGASIFLTITLDRPSIVYVTRKSNPTRILGGNSVPITHHSFRFPNFSLDTPGVHQVTATVRTSMDVIFSVTVSVVCTPIPTFLPVSTRTLAVNHPDHFRLYGAVPTQNSTSSLKIHRDASCEPTSRDLSPTVGWPTHGVVTLIPYDSSDTAFLCLSVRSANTEWYSMMRHYTQKFNEAFPVSRDFQVLPVQECSALGAPEAAAYAEFGWTTAEALRKYGCGLLPPVVGTVPPCGCPFQLRCEIYRHHTFTPSNLDIGRCVCCAAWVLTAAWAGSIGFIVFCVIIVVRFL